MLDLDAVIPVSSWQVKIFQSPFWKLILIILSTEKYDSKVTVRKIQDDSKHKTDS
jgi:hypothetical protein